MATEYSHLYYYSADGNSDKEYIVFLEDNEDDTYSVYALYGRRGHAINRANKVENTNIRHAQSMYRDLIRQKEAKGYRVFSAPKIPVKVSKLQGYDTEISKTKPTKRMITL